MASTSSARLRTRVGRPPPPAGRGPEARAPAPHVVPVVGQLERQPLHRPTRVADRGLDPVAGCPGPSTQVGQVGLDRGVEVAASMAAFSARAKVRSWSVISGISDAARRDQQQRRHPGRIGQRRPRRSRPHRTTPRRRAHARCPGASSTSRTSWCGASSPAGLSTDSPYPRRSTRTTSRRSTRCGHTPSHIRRSATPAWTRRSGTSPAGPLRSEHRAEPLIRADTLAR